MVGALQELRRQIVDSRMLLDNNKEDPLNAAEKAIRAEIERRESELDALRRALASLTGTKVGGSAARTSRATPGRKRRPKTAAEKKVLSEKLRAAWKRRKAAEKRAA